MNSHSQNGQPNYDGDEYNWPVMICLLGDFRLLAGRKPLILRAGGKSETVLAYLGLKSQHRIARDELMQLLWPASDPAHSLGSINSLVYNLHKLLGPYLQGESPILYEEGHYRLNLAAGIGVDVINFEQLLTLGEKSLKAGDMAAAFTAFQRAAQLYRDDLYLVEDVQNILERERLRAAFLNLLAQLAHNYYQGGDYSNALKYLWQLLKRNPYREDAHRLVMRCYVRMGERATALSHYQVCVNLLQKEFGVAPERNTTALFEQIKIAPDLVD